MAAYTVRITGWALKRKSKLYRALNHYLRSLQSLKHTYHLRIRLGGVSLGRESFCFRFRIFSKAKPGDRRIFSNERFLVLDYTLSELLAVVAAA
jgi:hypothetical protein